jgi:DNA-binding response OmpR family regulator
MAVDLQVLSLDQGLAPQSRNGGADVPGQLEGKRILIVDDDPDILSSLQTLFADTGAEVKTARDGSAAVEAAGTTDPDLVVLDALLPKMSGFLVLEKLKKAGKQGTKPFVIMITGNQGKRHQAFAESRGVDVYLNKPFRMERLMESVRKLLGAG